MLYDTFLSIGIILVVGALLGLAMHHEPNKLTHEDYMRIINEERKVDNEIWRLW